MLRNIHKNISWKHIFNHYRIWIVGVILAVFAYYASYESHRVTAIPATYWMNMYSYKDYPTWEAVTEYLIGLRTGIPPALSGMEVVSYNLLGGSEWIHKGLYRKAIIAIVILPLFFTRYKWAEMIWVVGSAIIFFESILFIHPANPQLYDVLLPLFLLLYFLLSQISFTKRYRPILQLVTALSAGFCLSMAELSRPFMIAIFPFLIGLNLYHYITQKQWGQMLAFLIPILILSGGWHLKLWHYNHQQIIWSNSSGTNLFRAWAPFVDQPKMQMKLVEEAPPIMPGRWQDINTEIHYNNSQIRKKYVLAGIQAEPMKALTFLWQKTLTFTKPRTDMYANDPQAPVLTLYRIVVKILFLMLPILVLLTLIRIVKNPYYLTTQTCWIVATTAFLCIMPIIGESGEEARFVISVLPFLCIIGIYALQEIRGVFATYIQRDSDTLTDNP